MNTETTPLGQYLLRRQAAAMNYVGWGHDAPIGCEQSAFFAGWDKAIEEVGLMLQTPGGDGCFCAHHPDDPAHTQDCYNIVEYLLMERGASLDEALPMAEIAGASPASIPTDGCDDAGYACDRDDIDLTMKQPLDSKW